MDARLQVSLQLRDMLQFRGERARAGEEVKEIGQFGSL